MGESIVESMGESMVEPRSPDLFKPGEWVRVMDAVSYGHCRTPDYLRGKIGQIHKIHGQFRNPESVAYGGSGLPAIALYQVEFKQTEIWSTYHGSARDTLWADIYHHWLERISHPGKGL